MSDKIRLIEHIKPDGSAKLCTESGEVLREYPPKTYFFVGPNKDEVAWARKEYQLTASEYASLVN